jgi:hypothetical protein
MIAVLLLLLLLLCAAAAGRLADGDVEQGSTSLQMLLQC